jgi:cell volume regulation protein A
LSGTIWLFVLRALHSNEHAYPVTLSALLILYVVVERLRGSAAFGILTFAIVLGNAKAVSARLGISDPIDLDSSVRGFHRQMAFIIKSFFFVFIGAMLGPPWTLIVFGMILGVILLVARWPSVRVALLASSLSPDEQRVVWLSMPRGMAAGVLATLPLAAGVSASESLPVAVFACVFTTILIFAVGFPLARRRLAVTSDERSAVPLPAGAPRPEPGGADAVHDVTTGGGAARVAGKSDD